MIHIPRLILFFVLALCAMSSSAAGFADESLNYVITYKWGLIHKDAGTATLSLRSKGNDYFVTLTARTKPWADRIFQVRDTLQATISRAGLKPKLYIKTAHEGGKYSRDMIRYSYAGQTVGGHSTKYREKDGKIKTSEKHLTGSGPVYDMLSVFYYLRSLDYARLKTGQTFKATIFSGSKTETLTFRSLGEEDVTLRNKKKQRAYHIKFKFTSEGKKKSSEDMDTWISTDPSHIPLMLTGSLPVGQVRCYYLP